MFLDESIITVRSGSGGRGCVSFRREKYVPRGGPDGGDGGRGGSVYLRACSRVTTLLDLGRRPLWSAASGRPGSGNNRAGRNARDLTVEVPVGTVVREVVPDRPAREGPLLADLLKDGQLLRVARGGKGGRGNKSFATSTHQVPRDAEDGQPGEERRIYLELKLLADVGLVGLPNAGKSTLLSAVSAARPKVADYPFTTLRPHLGILETTDYQQVVFADIPGLLEGAHDGVGLGIEFLRHIERTKVLLHLVSVEPRSVDVLEAHYRTIERELSCYSAALASKPRLVVLSKMDLVEEGDRAGLARGLSERLGRDVVSISAVTGLGVRDLVVAVARLLSGARSDAPPEPGPTSSSPASIDSDR